MMAETMTQPFNSLNINSKRLHKNQNDVNSEMSSTCSSKNSICLSTTNSNDWHRLLLDRLKPGVTRKYRTTRKDGNKSNTYRLSLKVKTQTKIFLLPIAILSTSFEDSSVTLQSYYNDSIIIDNRQIILTESDTSKQFDSSIENSIRKDNRFIKKSMSCGRSDDHITSLKRRVRKQQMRHPQNQPTILQETTFQLPSPTDLFLMSYPKQNVSSRRYKPKNSSCVVPLPPLMNTTRTIPTHMRDVKLNFYGYS